MQTAPYCALLCTSFYKLRGESKLFSVVISKMQHKLNLNSYWAWNVLLMLLLCTAISIRGLRDWSVIILQRALSMFGFWVYMLWRHHLAFYKACSPAVTAYNIKEFTEATRHPTWSERISGGSRYRLCVCEGTRDEVIGEMCISAKKRQFIIDPEGTAKEKTAEKAGRMMLIMDMFQGSKAKSSCTLAQWFFTMDTFGLWTLCRNSY